MSPFLNERGRRLFAANEAISLGRGGVTAVAAAIGLARSTINRGGELELTVFHLANAGAELDPMSAPRWRESVAHPFPSRPGMNCLFMLDYKLPCQDTKAAEVTVSCEIPKTRVDLLTAGHMLQNIADTSRGAHCNGVPRIELGIVEIELR